MIKLISPFVTGGYVSPKYFCDREEEIEPYPKRLLKKFTIYSMASLGIYKR